jgi:hypothetical protein
MKYLHSTTYFPIFVLSLAIDLVVGHQAKENRRDFQKFDTPSLSTLSNIGPAQWENVDEGHLGRLLIPRAGMSFLLN